MASFLNTVKNATSNFLNTAVNSVSLLNTIKTYYNQFLLLEDGGYLLLEDGGKIILEQNIPQVPSWNTLTKS